MSNAWDYAAEERRKRLSDSQEIDKVVLTCWVIIWSVILGFFYGAAVCIGHLAHWIGGLR
jgi:hypothetical protein